MFKLSIPFAVWLSLSNSHQSAATYFPVPPEQTLHSHHSLSQRESEMVFMQPLGKPQAQCRFMNRTRDELLPTLEPLALVIASEYHTLCDNVQKHGEKIYDNWNQLDEEAKRDVLLQAMPKHAQETPTRLEMYLSQRWRDVGPHSVDANGTFDIFALEHMAKVHASEFFTFSKEVLAAFSAKVLNDQLRQLKGVRSIDCRVLTKLTPKIFEKLDTKVLNICHQMCRISSILPSRTGTTRLTWRTPALF
jgi:hypothetical protein